MSFFKQEKLFACADVVEWPLNEFELFYYVVLVSCYI